MVKRKRSKQPEGKPSPPPPPHKEKSQREHAADTGGSGRLTAVVLTGIGLLSAVHLVSSFMPGLHTWGIDYWSEFPVVIRLGLVLLLGLMMAPGIAKSVDRGLVSAMSVRWGRWAGLGVLGALFMVFHSHGYSYGDGYSFMAYFPNGTLPVFDAHLSTQFFDIIVHWALYRFVLLPMGGTIVQSYMIWGALGGVFALWAIGRIASSLSRDTGSQRFIVAMAVTSGAMFLWFGHVESYTLVNAAVLWMIAFALESKDAKNRIWVAWGLWLLAMALHQLALAFLPALVWVHWRLRHTSRRPFDISSTAALFGAGFLAWAVATFLQRHVGLPIFVPIYSLPDTLYSAFSLQHLIDAVNLLLLLAPAGLLGLAVWPMKGRPDRMTPLVIGSIGVMAAWAWYFTFWVDPLIGAFRDWDLLAAFGIPMSLWAGATIVNRFPRGAAPRWLWVPVVAFGIVHAGAFVGSAQSEQDVAYRVDRLVREDVHYTAGFFDGTRLPPWAAIIGRTLGRFDLARDHLSLRVKIDSTDALAWANLGNAYRKINMPDSALYCYREASDRDTTDEKFANNLGVLYTEDSDWEGAAYAFERVVSLSDTAYAALSSLGLVYINLGRYDDARPVLDRAIAMRPKEFSAYYNRGLLEEIQSDTAAAIADYESATKYAPGLNDVYQRLVQLYQWSGEPLKGVEAAQRWARENPKSVTAPFLEGTCYYMLNQDRLAQRAFENALRLEPDNALTCYYMASTQRRLGNMELARQYAQQSANLNPSLALPYLELVYIAADVGDHEAAVKATHEYLKRAPSDSGMVYLQQFMK